MADWDENSPELAANLRKLAPLLRQHAGEKPTLDHVRKWHTTIMRGLAPTPDTPAGHAGRFRGETPLEGYNVRIGKAYGAPASSVANELAGFLARLQSAVADLDLLAAQNAHGIPIDRVLKLCAQVHTEWIYIHPFANGNGRTARCWVIYLCERYRVLQFLTVRPRPPGADFAEAAKHAMKLEWKPTYALFKDLYARANSP